jgi:hypothetical protein
MHALLTGAAVGIALLGQFAPPERSPYAPRVGSRCSCVAKPDARRALRRVPHVVLGEIVAARDTVWALVPDSLFIDGA